MAPRRLEKQIKEKLDQRQIQPSNDAWERLATKLDAVESPRKKRLPVYWIAASVIGLLILSIVFLLNRDTIETQTPMVETETPKVEESAPLKKDVQPTEMQIADVSQEDKEVATPSIDKESIEQSPRATNSPKTQKEVVIQNREAVATISSEETQQRNKLEKSVATENFIDQKVQDVVATIENLQKENKQITDEEIEALLASAQRSIDSQRIHQKGKDAYAVDAESLLLDVEDELDQSFRNRVFEALKTGFKKVKTSVAERNQ